MKVIENEMSSLYSCVHALLSLILTKNGKDCFPCLTVLLKDDYSLLVAHQIAVSIFLVVWKFWRNIVCLLDLRCRTK